MTGLHAEIIALIQELGSLTRRQLVAHVVAKRNLYQDAVHKTLYELLRAVVLEEGKGGSIQLANPPRKAPTKPQTPKRVMIPRWLDGKRRCSTCHQYLDPQEFTGVGVSIKRNCKTCCALLQRARRKAFVAKRTGGYSGVRLGELM